MLRTLDRGATLDRATGFGLGRLGPLMLLGVLTAAPVLAQPKPLYLPGSTHVFPAGGRRGSTVDARVGGECIPPATFFHLRGQGVRAPEVLGPELHDEGEPAPRRQPTEIPATYPRQWQTQIEIDDDAPLGIVYWRLSCAQGGTGSRPFIVGDLPEFIERESNSLPQTAERVSLPVTLNGQIHSERDADYYCFGLEQGELVVGEVLAGRLGSRLDPLVQIFDANNRLVDAQQFRAGSDPIVIFRAAESGEYLLRVADVTVHGSPAHVYRINLTGRPYVPLAFPAGGQAGSRQEIELLAFAGNQQPQRILQSVEFPSDWSGGFHLPRSEDFITPVELIVDSLPNFVEREPNTESSPMEVSLPATVHGRFLAPDDEDRYVFQSAAAQQLQIVCRAAPSASAALPTLLLLDANGRKLAACRSVESAHGTCRIGFSAMPGERFQLVVRDLQYGVQGGPEHIYRLSIMKSQPDFDLFTSSDSLNVQQGATASLEISIDRQGGFDGPIDIACHDLPSGVTIENPQIAAGATTATLKIAAAAETPAWSHTIRVDGRATIDGQVVEHPLRARHLGADSEGVSLDSPTLDQLQLTVQHKPLFRLLCSEAYMYAYRGSIYPYVMEVERLEGFDGPITLQIGDRQNRDLDGIEMLEVVIPPGKSQTLLPIYLPETMHINVQSQSQLYSQGYAMFTDSHNRRQAILVLSDKRNMLRTMPPVVKLRAVDKSLVATGGELACRFRLERTSNFSGPMQLKPIAPAAASVMAQPAVFAAGQNEATVTLRPDALAEISFPLTVKFRATGRLNNGHTIISEDEVTVVGPSR